MTDPEWRLLELISSGDADGPAAEEARRLAANVIRPDDLIALAARHRLVAALADFLIRTRLIGNQPDGIQNLLHDSLAWLRHKTTTLTDAATRLRDEFAQRDIRVAFTKGIVCHATIYDGRGTRDFSDIDLMILPGDGDAVADILTANGYTGGVQYDPVQEELVDIPRELRLMYQLYPDHLPHFFKLTGGSGLPYIVVDVAFSITWYGSAWQAPMPDVLKTLQDVPVAAAGRPALPTLPTLPTLDVPYGFLFMALHLFRESWFQRNIDAGLLRLGQFADIHRFWRRLGRDRADDIRTLINDHGFGPPVAWVCHHVDALFAGGLITALKLEACCDPAWLQSAGAADGGYLSWRGDMRSRLRLASPPRLTPAPEPPFGAAARVFRT